MAEPTDEQLREARRQIMSEEGDDYGPMVRERALRIAERAEHAAAIAELCGITVRMREWSNTHGRVAVRMWADAIDEVISKK